MGSKLLILDVGSGDNPHPSADILCDLYPKGKRQRGGPIKTFGKRFIVCDAQFLPFKDQTFAYVYCTHVIEHTERPDRCFFELKRVSRHGYIETPSWLAENILYGWSFHRWIIRYRNNNLYLGSPRRLRNGKIAPFGAIFHRLHAKCVIWRAIYYVLDEYLHLFTTKIQF